LCIKIYPKVWKIENVSLYHYAKFEGEQKNYVRRNKKEKLALKIVAGSTVHLRPITH